MVKKYLLALVAVFILAGCATGEKVSSVNLGMNKSSVTKILGAPDGAASNGDYDMLVYSNRMMSGWSYDKADYKFIFKNDSLVEYGPEKIRQDNGVSALRAITAQQSLLLWQQQQNLYKRPAATTNCTKYGNSVNCNTY